MTPRVRILSAGFRYGDHSVFRDVSLDLHRGEVVSLLGANGCGKTTLLKCVGGGLRLREGKILLNGRDVTALGPVEIAKTVGFVFQEHTVAFPYSVLDLVKMGRTPHLGFFSAPSERDVEIAARALETVGIAHLSDKPCNQISGGERQLALIARALAQEPEVLLLDEPTSNLDFGNQALVLQTIRRLVRENELSVMMTTHFPNHAVLVSGRVALMKDGGFIAVGAPDDVINEQHLETLYRTPVSVVEVKTKGVASKMVVPIMPS